MCRLVNGHPIDDIRRCSLHVKDKPWGGTQTVPFRCYNQDCWCKYHKTRYHLKKLQGVKTEKMLWWDRNSRVGRAIDLFRFWFFDDQRFEERILKQTLIPYVR